MWTSVLAILAGLVKWYNTTFGPEAVLRRKETKAAEQQGRIAAEVKRLKAAYKRIDAEKEKGVDETLARIRKPSRRR